MTDDLVQRLRRTYRKEYAPTGSICGDISNRLRPFPILAAEVLFNPDGAAAADCIEALEAENERLRDALQSVVSACDQGKLIPLGGPCGMTIDAQIRGSVYNRVPAWPVEEARAALDALGFEIREKNDD